MVISPLNRSGNSEITYFAASPVFGEPLFALLERGVCFIAFDLRDVSSRVMANAGRQFDRVGQFYKVVICAESEGFRFYLRFLFRGQDNRRNVFGGRVRAIESQHGETIDLGHDEVLKDNRRTEFAAASIAFVGSLQ